MKRMVELQQQQEEEECTQEEMVTRFERERSESIPTGRDKATWMQTCPPLAPVLGFCFLLPVLGVASCACINVSFTFPSPMTLQFRASVSYPWL